MLTSVGRFASYHGLKDPKVQKIVHSKDLHFDLVITEQFFQEAWLMFAYKFNAPIISISEFNGLFLV